MGYIGNSPGVASQRVISLRSATPGQTHFVTSGYQLGYLDVSIDGIDLDFELDYTANDGITFDLAEACDGGERVKITTWIPRGLSDGYTKAEADARFEPFDSAYTKAEADNLLATKLTKSSNLSDLTDTATARSNLGIGNVENKSSATIRGELTSGNVTNALGYTPVNKAGDTITGVLSVTNTLAVGNAPLQYGGSGNVGAELSVQSSTSTNAAVSVQSGLSRFFIGTHYNDNRLMIGANGASFPTGDSPLIINTSGHISLPYQPAFFARNAETGSGYNSANNLTFYDMLVNRGNHFNKDTGIFTAPISGIYYFSFSCQEETYYGGWGGPVSIGFYVNGIRVTDFGHDTPGIGDPTDESWLSSECLLPISTNDQVSVRFSAADSTPSLEQTSGGFMGYLLG